MILSGNDKFTKRTWFTKFCSSMLNRSFPAAVWILAFYSFFSYMDRWIWNSTSNTVCASLLILDTIKQFQVLSLCFPSPSCSPKQWLERNTFIERGFQGSKNHESPVISANIFSPKLDDTYRESSVHYAHLVRQFSFFYVEPFLSSNSLNFGVSLRFLLYG